ncbi:MAG: hypothetical protein M0C28_07480, partial [Candidatus Moduliflexus flocculans]|nr:hypothetical protein [Candidatus Moduliflexus flocculans]
MRRTAGFILLGAALSLAAFGQTAADPAKTLDARVRDFLAAQKDQWRQENVTEADGRLLHDLILKRRYTRALEIGTSTGHSGIWQAWALSKTGGTLDHGRDRRVPAPRGHAELQGLGPRRPDRRAPGRRPPTRRRARRPVRLHLHRRRPELDAELL